MADQTDFTQIAADFARSPEPNGRDNVEAAADGDTSADGTPADDGGEAEVLPADAMVGENGPAVSDDVKARDTDVPQVSDDGADSETPPMEKKPADDADGEIDGDGSLMVSDASARSASAETSGIFDAFPAAPCQPGEFKVPLCELVIGERSPAGVYDFDGGAGESLLHAVQTPEAIAPLVVTKVNDEWHVLDGWARVTAMRFHFGNTANILVRVVEWDGTRNDALYDRFAATFLTLKSRKIDKSILLREFHLAWAVPQLILAARIGWTESRVTRELAAAETMLEAPRFAELHVKAGDPPIDYLYKVQQARDAAAADDAEHPKRAPEKGAVAKLDAKLEALLAKPERFATAEALAKLGIDKPGKARSTPANSEPADVSAAMGASQIIDCVEDSGGDAIAMIEMGSDQLPSIRLLVDATAMDDRRRAEVRHLIHEALDRLLGF